MTAIADSKHRVTLRQAKPGDRFDVKILEEGKYVLTRLEPVKPQTSSVRLVKRHGYTVGVLDHPIDPEALRQALARIFHTPMETPTPRRVRARGLQARITAPVGRVPSRGARGCEISGLADFP